MTTPNEDQDAYAVRPAGRQIRKSAEMRRRVLEGTVACLAKSGFHGTSVSAVIAASRVSQGALQHHFPSKQDLIAAAATFLLDRSIQWFARIKDRLLADDGNFAEAVRRSWDEQFKTPEYAALLEILVAARTDEALRQRIRPALTAWRDAVSRELKPLVDAGADARSVEHAITVSRAMMSGLVVHDLLIGDTGAADRVVDCWADIAARIARHSS